MLDIAYWKARLHLQNVRARRARTGRVPHRLRPEHQPQHPVHITWRLVRGLPSLRQLTFGQVVGRTIRNINRSNAARGTSFRVIHFSIQADHLHLIVEGGDNRALTAGLRGLGVWIARRVNTLAGRSGRVLADRYHARALTYPRQVRNAILYVIHNHKKHEAYPEHVDRYSSARWFGDWTEPRPPPPSTSPVLPPNTWLARRGWQHLGRISAEEYPRPKV
jgi:REP-associated tyrosine transposase